MRPALRHADLYINGKKVGSVHVRGWESSWGYGEFHPNEFFTEFAPVFGQWSLLMHADEDERALSEAASEELQQAEVAMDRLKSRLHFSEADEWHDLGQVNIDGILIEWKRR